MKNVLLLVHDDVGQEARLQCALDLTRAVQGHLTCVDVEIMPRCMDDYVSSGGLGVLLAEDEVRQVRNCERLEQRLEHEDVPWNWADASGSLEHRVRLASRLSDIIVVNARLDQFPHYEMKHLAGELIVKSGRPLLAVPQKTTQFRVAGHALVAWDGSPPAEAALQAAVPLLALARDVTLVEVDDGSLDLPVELAAEYLSRHGITPIIDREKAMTHTASTVLLAQCDILRADWLVMGGFGHHRLIEASFGGVTRRMFHDAEIPLFLAH
jgi:nucleotide-binding universal stress UspA family protein